MALERPDNRRKSAHPACRTPPPPTPLSQYWCGLEAVSEAGNKNGAEEESLEAKEQIFSASRDRAEVCGWWYPGLDVAVN